MVTTGGVFTVPFARISKTTSHSHQQVALSPVTMAKNWACQSRPLIAMWPV